MYAIRSYYEKMLMLRSAKSWDRRTFAMASRSTSSSRNAPWKWCRQSSDALVSDSARISTTVIPVSATTLADRRNRCFPR